MHLVLGQKLGPYEMVSLLGAGGMGEVYRAKDTRLDRSVAIKVLPSQLASDPEKRQRFEREARSISTLSHPHICILHFSIRFARMIRFSPLLRFTFEGALRSSRGG